MHTNIMVFIGVELLTTFRQYPTRRTGLTALAVFMGAYLVWLHVIHHYSGVWVYPVLEVLAMPQRIVFFAVSLVAGSALYFAGELFNQLAWRSELRRFRGSGQPAERSKSE